MWYNSNFKTDIRPEFIAKEMNRDTDVREFKLKKRFISWLFRHYFVWEFCINWFDDWFNDADWNDRISWNNWQDPYAEGIWDMSQHMVDKYAKKEMNRFRKAGHLKGRCWIGNMTNDTGDDLLHVYLYGRDIHEFDYHFIMKKRGTPGRQNTIGQLYKHRPDPCKFCDLDDNCPYHHSPDICCDKCWYVKGKDRNCSNCNGGYGSV